MSAAQRIRKVLLEGPSTSVELALALKIDKKLTSAHLCSLRQHGHVTVIGWMPSRRPMNIFALTPRGVRNEKTKRQSHAE